MNNLKYYNDSLAYDFNLFMPKEKPVEAPKENIIKMPKADTRAKAKKKLKVAALPKSAVALFTAALLVIGMCGTIALRIGVNELNSQINKAQTTLNTLESEKTALQMEYENRISYANLEAEATAIGMVRLGKDQVKYIRVNDTVMAKNSNGETMVATK